jgi:tetratricopeptide (TPR) repeat protein
MNAPRTKAASGRKHPWRASVNKLADTLRGSEMQEELSSWAGGTVLWDCFCDVRDWAVRRSCGKAERGSEFTVGPWVYQIDEIGQFEAAVQQPLLALRNLLAVTGTADRKAVSLACQQISEWGRETAHPVTEFCFSAVGVLWNPDDAWGAYRVGRLARVLAYWAVAERWLGYAVALAERQGDGASHVAAVLCIGNVYYRQGYYRRAKEMHRAGLAIASEYKLLEYQARAYHDLFVAAVMLREEREADDYARKALDAYGSAHPNVVMLAHDVAHFWLHSGNAPKAMPIFQALLRHFTTRRARLTVAASLARAAGQCGRKDIFIRASAEVWKLASNPDTESAVTSALLEVAHGAASLGLTECAFHATVRAARTAEMRAEREVLAAAPVALESFKLETSSPTASRRGSIGTNETSGLAEDLIRSLVADHMLRSAETIPHSDLLMREGRVHIEAHAAADAAHTVFRYHPHRPQIVEYATFVPADGATDSPWEQLLRFEMEGSPSFNRVTRSDIAPPHVHGAQVPGGVRAALAHEIPARPW